MTEWLNQAFVRRQAAWRDNQLTDFPHHLDKYVRAQITALDNGESLVQPLRHPDAIKQMIPPHTRANGYLLDAKIALKSAHPNLFEDDHQLELEARKCAQVVRTMALPRQREFVEAHGITVPKGKRVTSLGERRRYSSPHWWKPRLRRATGRKIEDAMRIAGVVKKGIAPYLSEDSYQHICATKRTERKWISRARVVSETTGETIELADIIARSLANPKNRRTEMIVRAKGLSEIAQSRGELAMMATLTAPSAYHRFAADGSNNDAWTEEQFTVREGQLWQRKNWARARAELDRQGIFYYGVRVAEPHHDGTVHWHVLIFAAFDQMAHIQSVLRRIWLDSYSNEIGANSHRVNFTSIDQARGSAVGYIAKYISKNIDGHGVISAAIDDETGELPTERPDRVKAWAITHGLRQFQFFGGPGIGVWREIRRMKPDSLEHLPNLAALAVPCNKPVNYKAHIESLGGIENSRTLSHQIIVKDLPFDKTPEGIRRVKKNQWGEWPNEQIVGLQINGEKIETHPIKWRLVFEIIIADLFPLGPVALTVPDGSDLNNPAGWTNPQETSTYGPDL